jgi:hypothetical protein
MGEPGTKIVLTLMTKIAETMARLRLKLPHNPFF